MNMGMRSITFPAAASRFSSLQPASVLLLLLLVQLTGFTTATTSSPSQRIAEGESTTLGEYPSTLSLGLTSWANVYHLHHCAGSILTETWVITAARCVVDAVEDVSRYYWLAGTNNLRQGGIQYRISRIIIHPGYDPNDSLVHDIALVQVKHPFEFSATIQPIALPAGIVEASSGTPGVVVGWGEVSQTLIQPDVLRRAKVTVSDFDACRQIYSRWNLNVDEEFQFCALGVVDETANAYLAEMEMEERNDLPADRSACRGDEGGPFFLENANSPRRVLGIVSWTYRCSPSNGYPGVYTKFSAYTAWISQHTEYLHVNLNRN